MPPVERETAGRGSHPRRRVATQHGGRDDQATLGLRPAAVPLEYVDDHAPALSCSPFPCDRPEPGFAFRSHVTATVEFVWWIEAPEHARH